MLHRIAVAVLLLSGSVQARVIYVDVANCPRPRDGSKVEQVAEAKRAFQAKTELLSPTKVATMEIRPELDDVIELDEV